MAKKIRRRRIQLRVGQRELARRLGCSQAYLYQVERGVRPLSAQFAGSLEMILKVKPGLFSLKVRRGRPPLSEEARRILRELRRAEGASRTVAPDGRKPRFPRSDWGRPGENPFWPMAIHLGQQAGERVQLLEFTRRNDDKFWRIVNSLRFDSWTEKDLVVQVGLLSVELAHVSLRQVGCALQSVCGKTGADTMTRPYPAFLFKYRGASVGWFPNRCVRTRHGHRWPDSLLVVANNGRKQTVVVEVDGPNYHQCVESELKRDADLAVPVLHVHPSVLQQSDGLRRILDWVYSKVA